MSLKCADLGHLASPKHVHQKWVQKLEEEVSVVAGQHTNRYVARSCKICRALDHLAMNSDVEHFIRACQIFRQGDAERKAGLPISPLMDRHKGGISKSQEGVSKGGGRRH